MADPAVFKMDQMTPVGRGEGVISHPMCGVACPSENITTGVSVFQPGVAIPMHYHNCEEMVVVLEGEGECEIDGVVTPLKAQDAGYAPTGVHHCYRNTGSGVMKILWVYGAKEVTRTFVETGVTVPHLSPQDRIGS